MGNEALTLVSRQDQGAKCSRGSPCPDGSCCNTKCECGYGEEVCGDDVVCEVMLLPFAVEIASVGLYVVHLTSAVATTVTVE
ncbi:hypothetical protein F5B21DRAFT_481391 [Xylaria acuta]|nr:hypothetical protein F5B21DRAFT_481391 [Xylaria acuta]